MSDKNTERTAVISFITRMLSDMDVRRIKLVYELVLGMTASSNMEE